MQSLHASELLLPGFSADDALSDDDSTVVTIHGTNAISACPSCGVVSDRIHSRYPRRLADLPIAGRRVVLVLQAC
ncbi:MAG: transposase family protein [Roseiarcus sp.]